MTKESLGAGSAPFEMHEKVMVSPGEANLPLSGSGLISSWCLWSLTALREMESVRISRSKNLIFLTNCIFPENIKLH